MAAPNGEDHEEDEEAAAELVKELSLLAPPRPRLHFTALVEEELAEAAAGEADAIADGLEAMPAPIEVFPVLAQELAARPTHVLAPVGLGLGMPAGTKRANPNELLRTASRNGALAAVTALLSKGAKSDRPSPVSGYTALHWACEGGHTAVAQALVKRGKADLEATTKGSGGKTPLVLAAGSGHAECVWTLAKDMGANIEARDRAFGWGKFVTKFEGWGVRNHSTIDPNGTSSARKTLTTINRHHRVY